MVVLHTGSLWSCFLGIYDILSHAFFFVNFYLFWANEQSRGAIVVGELCSLSGIMA